MWISGRRSAPLLRQRGAAVGVEMGRNWAPLILRRAQGPAPTAPPGPPGWSRFTLCRRGCRRERPPSSTPQVLHLSGGATSPYPTPGCFSATSKGELKGTLTPPHPTGKAWGGQSLRGNAGEKPVPGRWGPGAAGAVAADPQPGLWPFAPSRREAGSTCLPPHPARWPGCAPPPRTEVQGPPLGPRCPPGGPHGGAQPRKGVVQDSPLSSGLSPAAAHSVHCQLRTVWDAKGSGSV